jgi:hypothetical protein
MEVKTIGIVFRGGISLLVASPFIAVFPVVFGQGYVRMPLVITGLIVGTIGSGMIISSGIQLVRERKRGMVRTKEGKNSQLNRENGILALLGFMLLPISSSLTNYEVFGSGYDIVPYETEGFYLGALAIGILFFVGFAIVTKRRASAILLSLGLLISGFSLLAVGLSEGPPPSGAIEVLVAGVFIIGLGIVAAFLPRRKMELVTSENS